MRTIGLVITLALCATAARADDTVLHWRKPNAFAWSLHAAATLSLAMDVSTALDIKNHQNERRADGYTYRLVEPNPILGEHPSDGALVAYFFGVAAIHTAVWYVLPEELRWIPDVLVLFVEVPQVAMNRANGLGFRLPF